MSPAPQKVGYRHALSRSALFSAETKGKGRNFRYGPSCWVMRLAGISSRDTLPGCG